MRLVARFALLALLLCLPLPVFAVDGYVTSDVNLRTGPGTEYPPVTVVPQWTGLQVQGCVEGYSWCDVVVGADRGWVYAQYLEFVQGGEPVYINDNGPRLGIPIVVFSLGTYWDTYYYSRPWYRYRGNWINHRPIYRPLPPPPSIRPPRPPINRPPINRPPINRPPINRPPPPRPRPPITTPPPRPGPPTGPGPGGRPLPNPGNGGNRPGPNPGNGGNRPGPNPGNGGNRPGPNPGNGGNRPGPNPGNGGNRPGPSPGNGGNRPGPGDSNNSRPQPPPRPQTRPAPQNNTQNGNQNGG